MNYPYIYAWRNNSKRQTLYGRRCRIITRGKMNSILIEFEDNKQKEVVSGNSIRKMRKEGNVSIARIVNEIGRDLLRSYHEKLIVACKSQAVDIVTISRLIVNAYAKGFRQGENYNTQNIIKFKGR